MIEKNYQDAIDRTFDLYGPQIREAYKELKEEDSNFGRYKISPGVYLEAQIVDGVRPDIPFNDLKHLERKLQEVTGDSSAKLLSTFSEYIKENRGIAKLSSIENEYAALEKSEWLDKDFRKKSLDKSNEIIFWGKKLFLN